MKNKKFVFRLLGGGKAAMLRLHQVSKPAIIKARCFVKINLGAIAEDLRKIGVNGMGVGLFGFFMPQNYSFLAASVILFTSFFIWILGLYLGSEKH